MRARPRPSGNRFESLRPPAGGIRYAALSAGSPAAPKLIGIGYDHGPEDDASDLRQVSLRQLPALHPQPEVRFLGTRADERPNLSPMHNRGHREGRERQYLDKAVRVLLPVLDFTTS